MQISIGIVEDVPSNRIILKNKLMRSSSFSVALIAENGKDFLQQMKQLKVEDYPDVVLMDLEMPVMDGVDTITIASYLYPNIRFVILTIFDDDERIFKAIKGGAYGYLLKDESSENITEMLLQMHETGVGPISPSIAYKMLQLVQTNVSHLPKPDPEKQNIAFNLTDREQEILRLLVQGLLYKEIGNVLNISINTAKKHVLNIYAKLHVNSKAQALSLVYEKGLL